MSATSPEGWVPADACTLPTADQPLRVAEFDAVFASALRSIERPEPAWLRLRFDADVEDELQDLTERESTCCGFFDFRLGLAEGELLVDVRVPSSRVDVLDGLERQATVASS